MVRKLFMDLELEYEITYLCKVLNEFFAIFLIFTSETKIKTTSLLRTMQLIKFIHCFEN